MKCRNCKKEIERDTAYKVGKASYYCDENCYNETITKRNKNKVKYEPAELSERRDFTDYVQSIYLDNGYDKSEINWTILMAQTKSALQEHPQWSYVTLQYILQYMYEIKQVNLFAEESNGSILSLLPFYGIEAEKYFRQSQEVDNAIKQFDFNDKEIIIKKNCNCKKKKYIDLSSLI